MSWVWICYLMIVPYLSFIGISLFAILIILLLRPFLNHYFLISERRNLLRENVKLQKKILQELQNLKSPNFKGSSSWQEEVDLEIEKAMEEEPIHIELKKDPLD